MKKERLIELLSKQFLTIATLASVVLGIIVGFSLRASSDNWSTREIMYFKFVGDIFLQMLKGLILPLIVSSLIDASASLNLRSSGKIGARAISYFLLTTLMSVILGIILVSTIRPGVNRTEDDDALQNKHNLRITTAADTILDLIRNMFPPNIIQACIEQYQTVIDVSNSSQIDNTNIKHIYNSGMNIIGLIVVACVCGVAMGTMQENVKILLALIKEISKMMMKITGWVINISPIGIFFLTVSEILQMDDMSIVFGKLGLYLMTTVVGILLHGFVVLPLTYYIFTRQNPYVFIVGMGQAIITAFGTGSSSATLPVSINCVEEKNKINPTISRFMLPIGATINMDGTALFEVVAAIFIAQLRNIPLSFGKIIAVCITSTVASIGAAGIPQGGLVTLVMVLDAVGLPSEDVSLIVAVDWIIDRFRTVVNVLSDAIGTGIVQKLSQTELNAEQPPKNAENGVNQMESVPIEN